jgi:putative ABC transport system ATP-binding protein
MLLELTNINKVYSRNAEDFFAVQDANLQLDAGDRVFITGKSGSGKSTLLHMIAGLLQPTSGEIVFNGKKLSSLDDPALSLYRNKQIGYIPQGHSILSNFKVIDNVLLPFYLYRKKEIPFDRAKTILNQIGILHLSDSYPDQLSGGELRRVSIARSLINEPKLLIADEPTGDLDPETTVDVLKLFTEIAKRNIAILIVTHETGIIEKDSVHLEMAEGCCRRIS